MNKENTNSIGKLNRMYSWMLVVTFLFTILGNSWSVLHSSTSSTDQLSDCSFGNLPSDVSFASNSPEADDALGLPEESDNIEELKEIFEKEKEDENSEAILLFWNPNSSLKVQKVEEFVLQQLDSIPSSSRSLIVLYHAWRGFIA